MTRQALAEFSVSFVLNAIETVIAVFALGLMLTGFAMLCAVIGDALKSHPDNMSLLFTALACATSYFGYLLWRWYWRDGFPRMIARWADIDYDALKEVAQRAKEEP